MLSSAVLFAGNAVYDYKFGKKTTAAIRQFESGKPSSIIDDVLNQTLLLTPPTIEIVGFLGGAARFIAKPCLKQRVMRFPIMHYGCSA